MKKKILIVLFAALLVVGTIAVTAMADEPALPTDCEHCNKAVTWTALDEAKLAEISAMSTPTLTTGHYYLAFEGDSCDVAAMTLAADKTVCLYMNGKTLNGTTRAFVVRAATLNIMGEGTILGHGASGTVYGGTIYGAEGSELNIYNTALRFEAATGLKADNGGVLYVGGVCNLNDVTVEGGVAKTGGNCFVSEKGHLTMSGGSIGTGTASTTGKSTYARGYVTLEKNATINELYFNPKSGGPGIGDFLTIKGAYTGTMKLRTSSSYIVDGGDIGNSDGADITGAKLSVYNSSLYVVVDGDDIKLSLTKPTYKRDAYCQHCKKTVQWTGLTDADAATGYIYTGHYYLAFAGDSCSFGTKTIVGHDLICIDLNGKHLQATDRAFHVHTGTLNIMDSVGGATVTGRGTTSQTYGGTLFVRENGTMNIYGGKFTYEDVADDGRDEVLRGGVLYIRGIVNMYGGEILGGAAKIGGNVYVDIVADEDTGLYRFGALNMYGGKVGANAALSTGGSITGPCVYAKSQITLANDASVDQIYFKTDSNGPDQSEMLTIEGAYTGKTVLRFGSYNEGMDVGTSVNADVAGAQITVTNDANAAIKTYGDELIVLGSNPVLIASDTKAFGTYSSLKEAIAAYDSTMGRIVLLADSAEAVQLTKDLYIDLNGYNLTGTLSGDKTLYCMDSRTDDFTVADGVYSRLQATDAVKIAAVPVEFEGAEDGYLMIEENGMLSFHRVNLQIKSMGLKTEQVGLYYICDFAGDEMVQAKVQKFGVALNATEEPNLDNLTTTSKLTAFPAEKFNTDAGTSSLLYGIMKDTNSESVNTEHAQIRVYGRAYIKVGENEYMFGQTQNRTLREQVEAADAGFANMSTAQMKSVLDMYDAYSEIMTGWEIPTINTWITNLNNRTNGDYTPYLSPDSWPSDVAAQAIADGKLHYYFMSGEKMLISSTQSQQDKWGDACLIVFPNGENMLIDTGPNAYGPVLTRNLLRMGVTKINYLVITHPHSDHVNGAFHKLNVLDENGFLNNIQVEQVLHRGGWDPESTNSTLAQRICDERGIAIDIMEKGDIYEIGGVKAEVIWPLVGTGDTLISGGEEVNNMSIVIRFDYGEHSSLFTGDLYLSGEEMVLANTDPEVLDVDFLKVPHHGYLTSSGVSFLNAISPELAVSTGGLNIPAKLRTRYADCGIEFLDDGTRGYIHVTGDTDGNLIYETTRNDEAIDGGEVNPDEDLG